MPLSRPSSPLLKCGAAPSDSRCGADVGRGAHQMSVLLGAESVTSLAELNSNAVRDKARPVNCYLALQFD